MNDDESADEAEIKDAVTGAFSYTGRYIAQRLLERGERVVTLTNHPNRHDPFGGRVEIHPYSLNQPAEMVGALRGVATFYNTYWVRFAHGGTTYERAVENSKILIHCARQAGVRRFVHVSITNASIDSQFSYFRGKGQVEKALRESGLSYAVLRPTVVFGDGGILIQNIAWLLRRFPIFAIPGRGDYRLQPVFVEDLAELAVAAGGRSENETLDAVGPETFAFSELVQLIAQAIGSRARIWRVNPMLALALAKIAGVAVGDVMLTQEEVEGLMANLLVSSGTPLGGTKLSDWLNRNSASLGRSYLNELSMHFR
jgi:uncharacterized protein YbjT (DUF2867 family)